MEQYTGAVLNDFLDTLLVAMGYRVRGELTAVQLVTLRSQPNQIHHDLFDTMFVIDELTPEGGFWRARERLQMLKERLPAEVLEQVDFVMVSDTADWPDGIEVDESFGAVMATLRVLNPDPRSLRVKLYIRESDADGVLYEEFAHLVQIYSARRRDRAHIFAIAEGEVGGSPEPWSTRMQLEKMIGYRSKYQLEMTARQLVFDDLARNQALGQDADDPTGLAERIYIEFHIYGALRDRVQSEIGLLAADPSYELSEWLAQKILVPARLTGSLQ